jgi:hypothetical protein
MVTVAEVESPPEGISVRRGLKAVTRSGLYKMV